MTRRIRRTDAQASPAASKRGWFVCSILLAAAGASSAGCGHKQPYVTPDRLDRGLVLVLPGIEGRSAFNQAVCRGLDEGGVDWAIELHDWTSPLGPLYNIEAYDRNRRAASRIGWRIARYRWDHPGKPVVIVGQSGGGAMAVWTAEQLLPGQRVDGIILLAAALSPHYILDFALENSTRGIVNFHSSMDWIFLGVGTTVTGTMDGRHTVSAGQVGFSAPGSKLSLAAYRKLFQVSWRPEMIASGNPGMHLTSGGSEFVAKYVAPLIVGGGGKAEWTRDFVGDVVGQEGIQEFLPESPPPPEPGK